MAKKSLIIHDLGRIDLKHLPAVIDIMTIDTLGEYDDHHIFEAAKAFIDALAIYNNPRTKADRQAIADFIKTTEAALNELKRSLV